MERKKASRIALFAPGFAEDDGFLFAGEAEAAVFGETEALVEGEGAAVFGSYADFDGG